MSFNIRAELAFGKVYERIGAEVVAEKLWPGCTLVATQGFADIDFIVGMPQPDGSLRHIAFLETKARRCSITQYDSTIVAERKHTAARWGREFYKVETVCLVLFIDGVATFPLHTPPDKVDIVVRHDRPGRNKMQHAFYLHSRFSRHDELLPIIAERVEVEQGIEAE